MTTKQTNQENNQQQHPLQNDAGRKQDGQHKPVEEEGDEGEKEPGTETTEPTEPEMPKIDPDTDTGDDKKKIPQ